MNPEPMCYGYGMHNYHAVTTKKALTATGTGEVLVTERAFLFCSQCGDILEVDQDEE